MIGKSAIMADALTARARVQAFANLRKELKGHKVSVLKAAGERGGSAEDKQDEADMIQNFIDQTTMKHVDAAAEAVSAGRAALAGRGVSNR
jgi:predicted hydrocarbon binding protein